MIRTVYQLLLDLLFVETINKTCNVNERICKIQPRVIKGEDLVRILKKSIFFLHFLKVEYFESIL